MKLRFSATGSRLARLFFFSFLVIFLLLMPHTAIAEDGKIYVNGEKLDSLFKFKKGIKYLPIEEISKSLGFESIQKNRKWTIRGCAQGEITISERDNKVISRDGKTYISESFWRDTIGLAVEETGNSVYIYNRIVEIKKYPDGLIFIAAAPLKFTTFTLDDPYRTVYDFKNLAIGQNSPEVNFNFQDVPFTSIRLGQFESAPFIGRIVVDHHRNSRYKPVCGVQGNWNNIFWIGNRQFTYKVKESVPGALDKSPDTILSHGSDGNLYFQGVGFKSVTGFYLWDTKPYRAVFDLKGCVLPFEDEKSYKGKGNIKNIRIGQFEPNVARIVVELDTIQPMSYYIISKDELQIFFTTPQLKSGMRVLIDAGHGGKDPGAVVTKKQMGGLSAMEKDLNLKLAFELGKILTERGVQVEYTRTDDRFIELKERRNIATRKGVDLFVSIHCNALPMTPQTVASGHEVYYYFKRDKELAYQVSKFIAWRTGNKGRGAFFRPLVVVMNDTVPSILVEAGFLDNHKDLAALLDPKGTFSHNTMLGVADGIAKIFSAKMSTNAIRLAQAPSKSLEKEKAKPSIEVFKPNIKMGWRFKRFSLDDFDPPDLISRGEVDREESTKKSEAQNKAIEKQKTPVKQESVPASVNNSQAQKEKLAKVKTINLTDASTIQEKAVEIYEDMNEAVVWTEEELRKRRQNIFKLY